MTPPLLAVVGLKREARSIAHTGVLVLAGGGDAVGLRTRLARLAASQPVRAVVSVGIGGALAPGLRVGDWVVAERIVAGTEVWPGAPRLVAELRTGLARVVPRVFIGAIAASDSMVIEIAAKASLHASSGALAVDMESHVTAAFAAEHGIPFAALRVISDIAGQALPKAVQVGMRPDGATDLLAVLFSLAKDPRQLPGLIRTGRDAEAAFRQLALLGRHDLLSRLGVGDPDLGQLPLDVV